MPSFPAINARGVITHKPYSAGRRFLTTKVVLDCGITYTDSSRDTPLEFFDLAYENLTDAELAVLEGFFGGTAEGRLNEFDFTDPEGNAHAKCRFDTDEMVIRHLGPGQHSVTLPIVEFK